MNPQQCVTSDDYVVLYAERLRDDPSLFAAQKAFLDSQYKASRSFFTALFAGGDFKEQAREYLRKTGQLR